MGRAWKVSRITFTPGIASAADVSTDKSLAPNCGGYSTLPCNIPGRFTSNEYLCAPVTISRPFTLASDVPATFHSVAGVKAGLDGMVLLSFCPCVSSPNPADLAPAITFPFTTVMEARSTIHFCDARSTSDSRAAAAARRICGHMRGVVWLPKVPWSNGVRSVSPITMRICAAGACSSSATACVSEVRAFCPTSTLPVYTVTAPSSLMCSQALTCSGIAWFMPRRAPPPDSCASASSTIHTTRPPPTTAKNSRREIMPAPLSRPPPESP